MAWETKTNTASVQMCFRKKRLKYSWALEIVGKMKAAGEKEARCYKCPICQSWHVTKQAPKL